MKKNIFAILALSLFCSETISCMITGSKRKLDESQISIFTPKQKRQKILNKIASTLVISLGAKTGIQQLKDIQENPQKYSHYTTLIVKKVPPQEEIEDLHERYVNIIQTLGELSQFQNFKKIKALGSLKKPLKFDSIEKFINFKNIEKFTLFHTNCGSKLLLPLSRKQPLKKLSLKHVLTKSLNGEHFIEILNRLNHSLEKLTIQSSISLTGNFLSALPPTLKKLTIKNCKNISKETVEDELVILLMNNKLPNLVSIKYAKGKESPIELIQTIKKYAADAIKIL